MQPLSLPASLKRQIHVRNSTYPNFRRRPPPDQPPTLEASIRAILRLWGASFVCVDRSAARKVVYVELGGMSAISALRRLRRPCLSRVTASVHGDCVAMARHDANMTQ
jgi:hypothetical protein